MKRILLLSAISIILSTQVKAQDKPKELKQPKTYTIGLQVDSAGYNNIMTALYKAQVDLNQSTASHTEVSTSIEFIEQLKKLFAQQKAQQDKIEPKKEAKKP